jgi:hypothetical protein
MRLWGVGLVMPEQRLALACILPIDRPLRECCMQHRGFGFNVVQGLGHDFWRWFATIDGLELSGDAQHLNYVSARSERSVPAPVDDVPAEQWHDQRGNGRKDEFDGRVGSGRRGVGERLHFSGARDRGLSRLDEAYRA